MAETIDRDTALGQNRTRFYTGKPCKQGHIAERYTANGGCVRCVNKVRRIGLGNGLMPWAPTIPLQVPDYFGEPQLDILRAKTQEFIDATVSEWVAAWDKVLADDTANTP